MSQSCLAEDAEFFLNEIKDQLSASVLLLDIKQGALFWSSQLNRYMQIFGLRFTKRDHIEFVKLHYELIVSEEQETFILDVFVQTFTRLLKRRELLSPEELCLPWRPAYKLWKLMNDTKFRYFPEYFPVESTAEMLAEWKHLFCPLDYSIQQALRLFDLFLPTVGPPESHSQMYRLWFDEFMGLYTNLDGAKMGWDAQLVNLFARLAADNIGLIDWEPHLATILSYMVKAVGLPVGPSAYHFYHSNSAYGASSCSLWLVAMISPTNSCMERIGQMLNAIAPFMHPSNDGSHQYVLHQIIRKLCSWFTTRVQWERYEERRWDYYIPDDQKLTDDQISQFVDIVKPLIFTGLFSKHGAHNMAAALTSLSFLQPERVLPQLVDSLYSSLKNLTEPYRLGATLTGVRVVARAMMIQPDRYPEGRLHIIPILQLCLPGIDSNDWDKTMNTFHLISAMAILISMVDCSGVHLHGSDLTENERELYSQTAQLQDFIFMFIDRLFLLIEGLSLDYPNANKIKTCEMEKRMESLVFFATTSVFGKTSAKLIEPAYEKIWRYMSGKVFEVIVAGRLAAAMIYGVASARPSMVLPQVIPYCCKNILELTATEDVITDSRADNSLLWNLLLLSEVVSTDGPELVKYSGDIAAVLDRTLHMTNSTSHTFACNILHSYMHEVIEMQPRYVACSEKLDSLSADYIPMRDWGMACNQEDLCIDWHIPGEKEFECVQTMVRKILLDELKYLDETEQYEREELTRRLRVITECIKGAGKYMPPLDSQTHTLDDDSVVHRRKFVLKETEKTFLITLNGENARNRILRSVHELMMRLLGKIADSAKPLHYICHVYKLLLFYFGADLKSGESKTNSYKAAKHVLRNPLIPDGGKIHYVHVKKTAVTLWRVMHAQLKFQPLTKLHVDACHDLVKMATSNYDDVQVAARETLAEFFLQFQGSEQLVIPTLCGLLTIPPPQVTEEQFKGALGLILNKEGSESVTSQMCLASNRNYAVTRFLWPAIIQAQHSDKPLIQQMVERIIEHIIDSHDIPLFYFKVSDRAREAALDLRLSYDGAADLDLVAGQLAAEARAEKYRGSYHELIEDLLELLNSDKLQWKHRELGLRLMQLLQRADVVASYPEVKLFCDSLVDVTPSIRKVAGEVMSKILYNRKHRHERQYVSGAKFPGYWSLQLNTEQAPITEEAWNNSNFVEKMYWGCTNMPERIQVTRSFPPPAPEELSEADRYILDSFSDEQFTNKFFHYMTLEENNEGDFQHNHLVLFQDLARNYGLALVDCCESAIDSLLTDTDHKTEKSRQRLVAEFVSGVIRGSKYWTFNQVMELFDWAIPVIKTAITNIADEVYPHWGSAFANCSTQREPKKLFRLFELLLGEVKTVQQKGDSATSLEIASRIYFLQSVVGRQRWRVPEINRYMSNLGRELLTSSSPLVRSKIGYALCTSYEADMPYINSFSWNNPVRADLIRHCLPLVEHFDEGIGMKETTTESQKRLGDVFTDDVVGKVKVAFENSHTAVGKGQDEEEKLILKSVLSWLEYNFDWHMTPQPWTQEMLCFLPIICKHSADFSDPELMTQSKDVAKYMCKTLLPVTLLPQFLDTIKEAMNLKSWHARVMVVEMLQSMMFLNQFHLYGDLRQQLLDLILDLLSDERIEVRLVAAETLSGGLQFHFFDVQQLLDHFKKLAATRPRSKTGSKEEKERRLHRCHTGVLGLGAIVSAYPYEVPEFIPDVLMILSDHIHDAQPIQQTVKDVLSDFRRTHLDSWLEHKQKFTVDQLMALADLSVSANYYA
ncbi:proteasome activator complex subunit 4-like isoform X2 [Watersipora subatra]|uniref:proteasome activator complex subunit 4-like isoform X2 n=1 Tax=Watersipora subatra TaxID=2589382 RepID=UPI00355BBC12